MNLEDFKAQMIYGVSKPSRYEVVIASPDKGVSPEIGLFAEEAEFPGKSFATRTMGLHGPAIKFPYQEIYADLQITFICSGDFWEKRWFEGWQRKVVNPKSGFFGYHKNYARNITIHQLNERDGKVYSGVAIDAWPLTLERQGLSYRSKDTYQTLTVLFAYTRFLDKDVLDFSSGDSGVSAGQTPYTRSGVEFGGSPGGPQLPSAPSTPTAS